MKRTFRAADGRRVRVKVSEAEAWRIRRFTMVQILVPAFWIVLFFRMTGVI